MHDRGATTPPRHGRGVFWNDLTDDERAALRAAGRPRTYAAGMTLCHQGDESDHIIIIESGWAKVTSTTESGHEVMLAVRGPGDIVAESAIIGHRERSATITAISPLQALIVPSGRFTAFMDQYPRAWRLISATFIHRLEDADRRLEAHTTATGNRRLALLLLYLADLSQDTSGRPSDGAIEIRTPLSQQELGSWIDLSREGVSRVLKELREKGVIRTGRRTITVLDSAGLMSYAHGKTTVTQVQSRRSDKPRPDV